MEGEKARPKPLFLIFPKPKNLKSVQHMLSQDALLKPTQMENKAAAPRCFHLYSLNDTWQVALFRTPEMLRRVMVAAESFLISSWFSLE